MPIGIIGTLIVATILYVGVSIVLTGMVSYTKLNVADPVAFALQFVKLNWVAGIISLGALAGMFTMMVTMTYSSSRLIYSIGRDGLLPKFLGKLDKNGSPRNSLITITIVIAFMGGFVPLDQLTNLVNIGTLIAFLFVSFGIIPLRRNKEIQNHHGYQVRGTRYCRLFQGYYVWLCYLSYRQKLGLLLASGLCSDSFSTLGTG